MAHKYIPIKSDIFLTKDVLSLSKYLLGKFIFSEIDNKSCVLKIVETEAYRGEDDKASHAYLNKKTERTKTMFMRGGLSYVYLCYGIHNMLNVVSGEEGIANAVLIRAAEPVNGISEMQERRNSNIINIANGPGKLCQALGVNRKHNGLKLFDSKSPIYLAENNPISDKQIVAGPRVGIAYAEECAQWNWRFRIKDNKHTSKPDTPKY